MPDDIVKKGTGAQCHWELEAWKTMSEISRLSGIRIWDYKQSKLLEQNPKDVLSDSGLEIELAFPFVPNRDPPEDSSTIQAR
ncbi:hypothetical protein TNCV_2525931 [Trichonephila clavipes]|nr:hypothetical protein TNCV_2525931 [Trichonephila clavipes]